MATAYKIPMTGTVSDDSYLQYRFFNKTRWVNYKTDLDFDNLFLSITCFLIEPSIPWKMITVVQSSPTDYKLDIFSSLNKEKKKDNPSFLINLSWYSPWSQVQWDCPSYSIGEIRLGRGIDSNTTFVSPTCHNRRGTIIAGFLTSVERAETDRGPRVYEPSRPSPLVLETRWNAFSLTFIGRVSSWNWIDFFLSSSCSRHDRCVRSEVPGEGRPAYGGNDRDFLGAVRQKKPTAVEFGQHRIMNWENRRKYR